MLSAKNVKIHRMKDERWTIKDKLIQYRGILKLHARDRKLQVVNATKFKKKVAKDLKTLTEDVKEYRGVINDLVTGDKTRMHTTLQHHKDFQLAFQNMSPDQAYLAIYQDNDLKRRCLDKLFYQKKKKMKEFFDLKLECVILEDKFEQEQNYKPAYKQQQLTNYYQQYMARQNAAKTVRTTYYTMLTILKKDAMYFDAVLDALKSDQKSQCKVLIKATEMGQLVTEDLDDTRQRYKKLAHDVWVNMRERERTLKIVRDQVDGLWTYLQSVIRTDSVTNFTERKVMETASELNLQEQLHDIEKIFDKVKESMLVRSYEELFPRLEEQMRQKGRLQTQFTYNIAERDSFLNKKNHALLILATLEHTMITTTGQYKIEKKAMLEELEVQKKREIDYKSLRKNRGELLMNIRAALQNMLAMLACIRYAKGMKKKNDEKKSKKGSEVDELDEPDENSEAPQFERMETDGLALLSQVSRKVGMLFGVSSFNLDKDREERAKDLYQTYISDYRSKLKFGKEEPEPIGFFVEHEVIDSSVLTRLDIKLQSRQIVEAHLKPE